MERNLLLALVVTAIVGIALLLRQGYLYSRALIAAQKRLTQ